MKTPNQYRIKKGIFASDDSFGNCGAFSIPSPTGNYQLKILASDEMDWEHVSVSLANRCPNWIEMSFIKSLFWEDDECVMQLHPPKKDYINDHPYCLHMWKPKKGKIPMPPPILVGIKKEKV